MRTNKLPQYIVNAVRRRARAAEQWSRADDRSEYCDRLGIETEFIHKHVDTLFRYYDPDFFIRDLETALDELHKKE